MAYLAGRLRRNFDAERNEISAGASKIRGFLGYRETDVTLKSSANFRLTTDISAQGGIAQTLHFSRFLCNLAREGNRVALIAEMLMRSSRPPCLELTYPEWDRSKGEQRNTNLAPVTLPQMIGSSFSLNAQLDEFQVHLLATRNFVSFLAILSLVNLRRFKARELHNCRFSPSLRVCSFVCMCVCVFSWASQFIKSISLTLADVQYSANKSNRLWGIPDKERNDV